MTLEQPPADPLSPRVRQAGSDDVAYFVRAVRALHRHEHQDIDLPVQTDLDPRLERWFARLLNDNSTLLLIADINDTPAGFILGAIHIQPNDFTIFSQHGMVHLIWVEPEWRGKHLAGALLKIMENCFSEQGVPYIEVQFALNNQQAEQFWLRSGYVAYGVQARKYLTEDLPA